MTFTTYDIPPLNNRISIPGNINDPEFFKKFIDSIPQSLNDSLRGYESVN